MELIIIGEKDRIIKTEEIDMGYNIVKEIKGYVTGECALFLFFCFMLYLMSFSIPVIYLEKNDQMPRYNYILAMIGIFLLIAFVSYSIFLRIKTPSKSLFYSVFSLIKFIIFVYGFYWAVTSFILHLSLDVNKFNLLLYYFLSIVLFLFYFRFLYYPLKFKKHGFKQLYKGNILDNERGIISFDVQLSRSLTKKEQKRKTSYKHSWIYVSAGTLGVLISRNVEISDDTRFFIYFIFFGMASLLIFWIISVYWHDIRLIRIWEKENGRKLTVR
jgi:hypothetical protein